MESKLGYKETKELGRAVFALAGVIAAELKNGFQPGEDLVAIVGKLLKDSEVQEKIKLGMEGVSQVPAEVADTQADEAFDFAALCVVEGQAIYKILAGK